MNPAMPAGVLPRDRRQAAKLIGCNRLKHRDIVYRIREFASLVAVNRILSFDDLRDQPNSRNEAGIIDSFREYAQGAEGGRGAPAAVLRIKFYGL
jgi:hypothetical protein